MRWLRPPLVRWINRRQAVFEFRINASHFSSLRWDARKDEKQISSDSEQPIRVPYYHQNQILWETFPVPIDGMDTPMHERT